MPVEDGRDDDRLCSYATPAEAIEEADDAAVDASHRLALRSRPGLTTAPGRG